jgi:putative CocE/NonD family hydrolase
VNGVFDLWFAQSWILNFFAPDEYRRQLIAKGVQPDDARKASDEYLAEGKRTILTTWAPHIPLASFANLRSLAPYYYEWLEHANYDDYWAKVDVETRWGKVTAPALVNGGWSDLFAIGSIRSFNGMVASGGSATARNGTKLVMIPGGHGGTGVLSFEGGTDILQTLQLRFYDHYLKGIDNGIDREPRVQLFVQIPPEGGTKGSGFWVTGDTFPLPGTEKIRFNVGSGGHANTRRGDGVLDIVRPSTGPDDTFVYNPRNPMPSHGGGLCCTSLGVYFGSGAQDQSTLELRDDVLVYTSAPLVTDLAVIGQVNVGLWAKSSARDTDFTAKLVDVRPDGFAYNVLDRVVRARFRNGSKSASSLIEPGKAYEYKIELGYAGTLFKAGHRVRLDISSSKFPQLARNQNTGNDPGMDGWIESATQTILHDADHPSYVDLSVVPGVKNPKP